MKKYKKAILSMLITITFVLLIIANYIISKNSESIIENNSNMLSFMVETTDGNYEQSQNIPLEDYIFNPESSGCDNGGKISWNMETSKIQVTTNKSDKCHAVFDKYDFTKSCKWGYEDNFGCYLIKNKDNTLIYHDGKPDYEGMENYELEAKDYNYRFSGGDYEIADEYKSKYSSFNQLLIPHSDGPGGSAYTYTIEYDNSQYTSNIRTPFEKIIADGYLVKKEIRNFICFGSEEETCPENNLYRIVGIYDGKLKLVKADFADKDLLGEDGSYYEQSTWKNLYIGTSEVLYLYMWNSSGVNTWKDSDLNQINLNQNFYNRFNTYWQGLIFKTLWQTGGISSSNNAFDVYNNELGNKKLKIGDKFCYAQGQSFVPCTKDDLQYEDYIGLLYASDYAYSINSKYWNFRLGRIIDNTYILNSYQSVFADNWLFNGQYSLINRPKDTFDLIIFTHGVGSLDMYYVNSANSVRPSFYLIKDIKYDGGTGTSTDPYRISK